jgi:hypothetical protein
MPSDGKSSHCLLQGELKKAHKNWITNKNSIYHPNIQISGEKNNNTLYSYSQRFIS